MELIRAKTSHTRIKAAIFDFDGTISTLRQGWETLMEPLMLEMISPDTPPDDKLIEEVRCYIDESTGIQTIFQMEWLVEKVKTYGVSNEIHDAWWYKEKYNEKLLQMVNKRIHLIASGKKTSNDYRIAGSLEFIQKLYEKGVEIYIASGTDDVDLQNEIYIVGIGDYVHTAKGAPYLAKNCSKEKVLEDLLAKGTASIRAEQIAVIGDGKVEIQMGHESGTVTIGTATNEINKCGINEIKRKKLITAGADIIISDFLEYTKIFLYLGY